MSDAPSSTILPICFASSMISASTLSRTPVRRNRASTAPRKTLEASGRQRRYCCRELLVASLMARLMVLMVTLTTLPLPPLPAPPEIPPPRRAAVPAGPSPPPPLTLLGDPSVKILSFFFSWPTCSVLEVGSYQHRYYYHRHHHHRHCYRLCHCVVCLVAVEVSFHPRRFQRRVGRCQGLFSRHRLRRPPFDWQTERRRRRQSRLKHPRAVIG